MPRGAQYLPSQSQVRLADSVWVLLQVDEDAKSASAGHLDLHAAHLASGATDEDQVGQTAAKHTPERPVMHHAHVHAAVLLLPSRPACLVLHLFLPNCPTTDQQ